MGKFFFRVDIDSKKLAEIMAELEEAKNTIYKCYSELQDLGVITVLEKNDAANGD